jgi:hypothetical protein
MSSFGKDGKFASQKDRRALNIHAYFRGANLF